jgi:excisionase family DNA binding protein
MTQQNGQEYIEIKEAASELGITRRTLEKHAEARGIQRYRRGLRNQVYFKSEDIKALKDWLYQIRPDESE